MGVNLYCDHLKGAGIDPKFKLSDILCKFFLDYFSIPLLTPYRWTHLSNRLGPCVKRQHNRLHLPGLGHGEAKRD